MTVYQRHQALSRNINRLETCYRDLGLTVHSLTTLPPGDDICAKAFLITSPIDPLIIANLHALHHCREEVQLHLRAGDLTAAEAEFTVTDALTENVETELLAIKSRLAGLRRVRVAGPRTRLPLESEQPERFALLKGWVLRLPEVRRAVEVLGCTEAEALEMGMSLDEERFALEDRRSPVRVGEHGEQVPDVDTVPTPPSTEATRRESEDREVDLHSLAFASSDESRGAGGSGAPPAMLYPGQRIARTGGPAHRPDLSHGGEGRLPAGRHIAVHHRDLLLPERDTSFSLRGLVASIGRTTTVIPPPARRPVLSEQERNTSEGGRDIEMPRLADVGFDDLRMPRMDTLPPSDGPVVTGGRRTVMMRGPGPARPSVLSDGRGGFVSNYRIGGENVEGRSRMRDYLASILDDDWRDM